MRVAALLLGAGVVGAVLSALPLAALWSSFGGRPLEIRATALIVAVAAAGDLVHARSGRLRPWALGRQVPQTWGHGRPAELVALRYGLRLGVGPATILTSWLWWAATLTACTQGQRAAALCGTVFAASRTITSWLFAVGITDGRAMSRRSAIVGRANRRFAFTAAVIALGVAVPAALVG